MSTLVRKVSDAKWILLLGASFFVSGCMGPDQKFSSLGGDEQAAAVQSLDDDGEDGVFTNNRGDDDDEEDRARRRELIPCGKIRVSNAKKMRGHFVISVKAASEISESRKVAGMFVVASEDGESDITDAVKVFELEELPGADEGTGDVFIAISEEFVSEDDVIKYKAPESMGDDCGDSSDGSSGDDISGGVVVSF